MPKKSNIAGVRFGSLVAVEPTDNRQNGYTIWRCLCDCGRLAFVSSRHLKNGWMTSCGDQACSHQQKSIKMKSRSEDLTGQRFGMLTVLSRSEGKGNNGQVLWNCMPWYQVP